MSRIALDLGIIQIYWYSIFIFLGVLLGSILIYQECKKQKIEEEFLINMLFYLIIFGILGARIYYVLFNISYYQNHLVEIFQIWNGGLAIHGAIISGILVVVYFCNKYHKNLLKILDILAVGLILGQAIGRWGNFFNSEAYGAITSLKALQQAGIPKFVIDGMYIMGAYHQPTFFYESVWNIFGFLAMILIRKYKYLRVGFLTGFYFVWYSVGRFIIEGMRTDSLMFGPFRMAQIVSIILFLVGIFIIIYTYKKSKGHFDNLYNEVK